MIKSHCLATASLSVVVGLYDLHKMKEWQTSNYNEIHNDALFAWFSLALLKKCGFQKKCPHIAG